MSILIKGLQMPKNMRFKAVVDLSEETAYVHTDEMGDGVFETCKAFSVPDHGELIDRDALNTIKGKTLLEAVYYAPVIIPAERSEE